MKTIAAAAFFLTLATTAWAEEPEKNEIDVSMKSDKPIVLSEAEMDGVTASGTITMQDISPTKHVDSSSPSPRHPNFIFDIGDVNI